MKYGTTYGNRNPKPGARKRVGYITIDEWNGHISFEDSGAFQVDTLVGLLPKGRYEIVKVDE